MSAAIPPPAAEVRSRVVYVAAWGPSLQQPAWARELGLKLNRPVVCSFDEAVAVAEAGARQTGFPAVVQKFVLQAPTATLEAVRLLLGTWRLSGPGGAWEELS